MKTWLSVLVVAALIDILGSASASPPGKDVQWTTPMGIVVFSGQAHVAAGNQCTDCHDLTGGSGGLYPMKQGTLTLTMVQMNEGKGCGACHNGEPTFSTADTASCTKCHKAQ